MFNKILSISLLCLLTSFNSIASSNLEELKRAEQYRLQFDSAHIRSEVELLENDKVKKTRLYDIYKSDKNKTLVVFKSPADAGQKVLMKDENFWMFMPKSRRPIRITALQKLLGEASLGDIANLSWSKHYKITSKSSTGDVISMILEANKGSASYQRIELELKAEDYFPIKAHLYLRSGMLSKVAEFKQGLLNGLPAVTQMVLIDKMRPKQKTVINYLSVEERSIPDKSFNPQILIRNDLDSLLKI